MAFAGGVNLYLHPSSYVDMSSQHVLSKDGICKSFGVNSNGFVPGEGVGVVLLKPLDEAIRDKDAIHGVIIGSSVNHGGKTNSYSVPNPKAQTELIRRAIERAGIGARSISYIEAHGTGTNLGDPIEVTGLQQAFAADTNDKGFCKMGSAKSSIGHLESAAGIAGLTKVLLQMQHKQIPPSLHAETLNPNIDFSKTAFELNREFSVWETPIINGQQQPRIAGISSFGAGGANAHVLVQEYIDSEIVSPITRRGDNPVLIILSARNEQQLFRKAEDLKVFVENHTQLNLDNLAYSSQITREEMDERLCFVVRTVDELLSKIAAYLAVGVSDGIFTGSVLRKNESLGFMGHDEDMQGLIKKWIESGKLVKLAELWVNGLDIDWSQLYNMHLPQRMSLPGYPFAKEQYWIDSLVMAHEKEMDMSMFYKPLATDDLLEDIINKIDDDSLDSDEAIRILKSLA